MAHIEMQLLSRIVRTGALAAALDWGIVPNDFRTTEGRGLFVNILGYWRANDTQGAIPGPFLIKEAYPTFEFCDDPSMTTEALCTEVRKNRLALEMKEYIGNRLEDIDVDPMGALNSLVSELQRLQNVGLKNYDSHFDDAMEELLLRYKNAKDGVGNSSLLWPWEPFNEQTLGIQEDDYIVLYGRPKSMKSFVLSAMAASAYDQGKKVLVYTKEMPAWQLFRRVGAFIARLPYSELRLGRLSPEDEQKLNDLYMMVREQSKATQGSHNIICISGRDAPAGQDSMSWVRSKVDKYQPDIVFIDGLYLMSADGKPGKDHERVASISRAARDMVLGTRIPLVATMQANRNAAKHNNAELDEIAYSDAIGQDATVAIRCINDRSDEHPTVSLVIGGSREFKLHGVKINARPCVDFSFNREMTEKEISKAAEKDAEGGEDEKKKKAITRQPVTKMNKDNVPTSTISEVKENIKDIV